MEASYKALTFDFVSHSVNSQNNNNYEKRITYKISRWSYSYYRQ